MPYIKPEDRKKYDELIDTIVRKLTEENLFDERKPLYSVGEINYVISTVCNRILNLQRGYQTANDLIGVLECIKLELYRRPVSDYENEKIKENGDIS